MHSNRQILLALLYVETTWRALFQSDAQDDVAGHPRVKATDEAGIQRVCDDRTELAGTGEEFRRVVFEERTAHAGRFVTAFPSQPSSTSMASLRDFGLTRYEPRTYHVVVDHDPVAAIDLAEVADVPVGRISNRPN